MKRFISELKNSDDLLFFSGEKEDILAYIPDIVLPEPRTEGDSWRLNIIIDLKWDVEIGKICASILKDLASGKVPNTFTQFQENCVEQVTRVYRDRREWLGIVALHHLVLFREHLYRLYIQVQKKYKNLSPVKRKALRFHAGLLCSRLFESLFRYKLPYRIPDGQFTDYVRLFNPLLLSSSFPEYFLSDYFCYLGITNAVWNKERYLEYQDLLLESAGYGLSSLIGVSLTSRGAALQKIYRLIKGKQADFSEKNAPEVVEKMLTDPSFFKEVMKIREFKKLILNGDLPKNMSKQDFYQKLQSEYRQICEKYPFSRFLQIAADAEILRKILNNIVLIDPREYPEGYGEIQMDYTLYLVHSPYIQGEEKAKKGAVPKALTEEQTAPVDKLMKAEAFEKDETVKLHLDDIMAMNASTKDSTIPLDVLAPTSVFPSYKEENLNSSTDGEITTETLSKEEPGAKEESLSDVIEQTGEVLSGPLSESPSSVPRENVETVLDDIMSSLPQTGNREADAQPDETHSSADSSIAASAPSAKPEEEAPVFEYSVPYILGTLMIPDEGALFLREKSAGPNFVLVTVEPKKANFKIEIKGEEARFLVNKKSNWHKPSRLKQLEEGLWHATIINKQDGKTFHYYLEDVLKRKSPPTKKATVTPAAMTPTASSAAERETPTSMANPLTDNSAVVEEQPVPAAIPEEFKGKSVAELSQALLDGLIDFEQYNALIGGKEQSSTSRATMDDPDVILEQGITYCSDWQGRIMVSTEEEADLRFVMQGTRFRLDIKEGNGWNTLYHNQEVKEQGFQSRFEKTIVFTDPTKKPGEPGATQKINKEYTFVIAQLIGDRFGVKFY